MTSQISSTATPVSTWLRVVAAMSSAVMARARAVLLAHGVSQDSTGVRIAHGAQVDPALGAAQVGDIRDPHAVQATVVPLAGAVILMDHRSASAAPGRARARVEACEAQAAHRRSNRPHTHTHESMADARSPIGAARHLVFPGHRLIHTPPHQRTLTHCGTLGFQCVIACARAPST